MKNDKRGNLYNPHVSNFILHLVELRDPTTDKVSRKEGTFIKWISLHSQSIEHMITLVICNQGRSKHEDQFIIPYYQSLIIFTNTSTRIWWVHLFDILDRSPISYIFFFKKNDGSMSLVMHYQGLNKVITQIDMPCNWFQVFWNISLGPNTLRM